MNNLPVNYVGQISFMEVVDFLKLEYRDSRATELLNMIELALKVASVYLQVKTPNINIPTIRLGVLVLIGHWFNMPLSEEPLTEEKVLKQPIPFGTAVLWNPHIAEYMSCLDLHT